jgi:hypothetical protein
VPAEQHRGHSHDNAGYRYDGYPLHDSNDKLILIGANITGLCETPREQTARADEDDFTVKASFKFHNNDPEELTMVD